MDSIATNRRCTISLNDNDDNDDTSTIISASVANSGNVNSNSLSFISASSSQSIMKDVKELENKIIEYDNKIIPMFKEKIKIAELTTKNISSTQQQSIFEIKVELEIARAERTFLFEELKSLKEGKIV